MYYSQIGGIIMSEKIQFQQRDQLKEKPDQSSLTFGKVLRIICLALSIPKIKDGTT